MRLREIKSGSCDYLSGKPIHWLMQRLHRLVVSSGLEMVNVSKRSNQCSVPFSRSLYYSNRCGALDSCGAMLTERLQDFCEQP